MYCTDNESIALGKDIFANTRLYRVKRVVDKKLQCKGRSSFHVTFSKIDFSTLVLWLVTELQ